MFATTQEFFDDLLPPITTQPLFELAVEFLKRGGKLEKVDIEQVLWALQELHRFFDNLSGSKDIAGYAIQQGILEEVYGTHTNAGSLPQVSSDMTERIASLIGEINQKVYELYSYEPAEKELAENWLELIAFLDGRGSRLDIFTTNYDVVIEAALNLYEGEKSARHRRGIRGNVRQVLDLTSWSEGGKDSGGLLTKLHGSLDWKRSGDQLHVGDPVFTGDHEKQAIIYPGFKGLSNAPFFHVFHNYLAESISDAWLLVFIGFAFRDEHINSIIKENIKTSSEVIVLNPDKNVKFPSTKTKVTYINRGFSADSIKRLVSPHS
jgi:hypothetical protein